MNDYCGKCGRVYDGVTVRRLPYRRGACVDCTREYLRRYRQEHVQQVREQQRQYRRDYAEARRLADLPGRA